MEPRQHDHPLDGTELVVLAAATVSGFNHTCIPKGFMY